MNYFSNLIKGLLLTTILIGTFSFSVTSANSTPLIRGASSEARVGFHTQTLSFSEMFVPQAFAIEDPTTSTTPATTAPATGGTAATNAAAGEEKETPSTTRDPLLLLEQAAKTSTFVNHIFNPLIHMLTFQIGNFLGNDYIFAGTMGEMLQNIWVVSRNIVNIAFVLILLYIALIHIFKGEENTGELVKKLRIFVIMLIAVNFSWLGTRLVLDAANVATQVVFSIPAGVKGVAGDALPVEKGDCLVNEEANGPNTTKGPCTADSVRYIVGATQAAYFKSDNCPSEKDVKNANPRGTPSKEVLANTLHNKVIYCWRKIDFAKYNQNNASLHLTFGMARVQNLVRANTNDDLPKTIIAVLFSLIIQVVFLVAFAALYVVLIARVAALWIFVAFSPFMVLLLFFKTGLGQNIGEKFSPGQFAKWAFAPAKVGAVWAVGFIMISAGQVTSTSFFQKVNADGIASNVINVSSLFLGMENMQEFIWLLLTLGIIWTGTFAMMADLEVVSHFTNRVGDWGKTKARWLATAPAKAPILPQFDSEGKYTGMTSFQGKYTEMMKTFQPGELSTAENFAQGGSKLKNNLPSHFHGNKLLEDTTPEKMIGILSNKSGVSKKDLVNRENETNVRSMLKTSGHFDSTQINAIVSELHNSEASRLIRQSEKRAAAVTPAAPATTEQLTTAVEKGEERAATDERRRQASAGGAATQPLAKAPKLPPPPKPEEPTG